MDKKDIIIIPTYNEKDNIASILEIVFRLYPELEIWVIDDNSPDGTAGIVSALAKNNPNIKLTIRPKKNGLGEAYKATLIRAQKMSDIRHIITMDADGSHNPAYIKTLIGSLSKYDMVIGSRYIKGGGLVGWSWWRLLISKGGNWYVRMVMGFRIHDATAGFVAYKWEVIKDMDIASIASSGYSYQIEFKNAVLEAGYTFTEIPIVFTDRQIGKSKMSYKIIFEGVLAPWPILGRRFLGLISHRPLRRHLDSQS